MKNMRGFGILSLVLFVITPQAAFLSGCQAAACTKILHHRIQKTYPWPMAFEIVGEG